MDFFTLVQSVKSEKVLMEGGVDTSEKLRKKTSDSTHFENLVTETILKPETEDDQTSVSLAAQPQQKSTIKIAPEKVEYAEKPLHQAIPAETLTAAAINNLPKPQKTNHVDTEPNKVQNLVEHEDNNTQSNTIKESELRLINPIKNVETTNTFITTVTPDTKQTSNQEHIALPALKDTLETLFNTEPDIVNQTSLTNTKTPILSILKSPQVQQEVIQNVIVAVKNVKDGPTEIRLDPPELGRVLVTINQTDTTVIAVVTADKPEILDLMRRHSELFTRELANVGFKEAELSFSHNQQHNGEEDREYVDVLSSTSINDEETEKLTRVYLPEDNLDIRI